jgi:NodT family efflux transporter outer membrane factor (OMF) lipoprotein
MTVPYGLQQVDDMGRLVSLARRTLMLAGAATLAACATLPPPGPKPVAKAPQTYASAQSLAGPERAWPGDGWWSAYGDAQLDGLIREALANSPSLAIADARIRKAASLEHRSLLLPNLSANGYVVEEKQSYNAGIPRAFVPHGYNDYGRATLDFSWELDFWGKNRAAVAAAITETRAAEVDAAEARLALSTNVAAAYADLARLFAERDVAERALEVQSQTSKLVADRVSNGLDTLAEQRQAEASPLQSAAELKIIDEQIALTRNRLAALAGAGPDRGLSIQRPKIGALAPIGAPKELAANLIGRRPDVVAARLRAEAAAKRIKEARAAFYPDVNLAAFIGVQSLTLTKLTASGSDIGSVGPAISLPIFNGGHLTANLRGAEADRDAAVASYDATLTEALHQVADVLAQARALDGELADSRAALAASEDAFRIASLRYKGGLSTFPAVLLAEQGVLLRRRAVADLEARAFTLDVELVRALGGGFHAAA